MIASPIIASPTFDEELLGRNFRYVSVEQKLRVFDNRESCCYRAHDRLDRLILVFSCQVDSRFEAVLNCIPNLYSPKPWASNTYGVLGKYSGIKFSSQSMVLCGTRRRSTMEI